LNLNTEQETQLKNYLLGRLPEAELEAIDERLVTEGDFYEEVLIAEDELIDQYLNNELDHSERDSFEEFFLLAPERRAKLQFSDSFLTLLNAPASLPDVEPDPTPVFEGGAKVIDPPPRSKPWYHWFLPVENPTVAYAFMTFAVVMIVGAVWLITKRNQGPEPIGLYAVVLKSGLTRGGGGENKFSVPTGTGTIELKAELQGDSYPSYEAVITGEDNSEVTHANKLQEINESGTRMLKWDVAARLLPPGDYSLHVSGVDAAGKVQELRTYPFRVLR
jgi:hypothetical protein